MTPVVPGLCNETEPCAKQPKAVPPAQEEKEAQKTITDFEEKWWKDCIGEFPSEPEGDGVAIARELVAKWKPFILKQADTKFRKNK